MRLSRGRGQSSPPRRHFRVAPNTQVEVGEELYGKDEEFSVEPELYLEADSWCVTDNAKEIPPKQKKRTGQGGFLPKQKEGRPVSCGLIPIPRTVTNGAPKRVVSRRVRC